MWGNIHVLQKSTSFARSLWPLGCGQGQESTSSAIVVSYAELVEASAVPNRELVIIGISCLLAVSHVYPQLISPLGCDLVHVIQPCREEQRI